MMLMDITVKKLKGTSFLIEAKPHHKVADLKKKIENAKGRHKYPAERQVLIHRGKVLKDETTLEDNNVDENGFVVVMLSPINRSCGETSTAAAPVAEMISCTPVLPPSPEEPSTTTPDAVPLVSVQPTQAAAGGMPNAIPLNLFPQDVAPVPVETSCTPAPPPSPEDSSTTTTAADVPSSVSVQPTQAGGGGRQNAIPLNLFPQDLADTMTRWTLRTDLDILRNSPRFRRFRSVVHVFPEVLQSWLEDLRERNPRIYRFIRQHQVDFDALMNEGRGDLVGDSNLTLEELAAIFRLEEMGFERALVIQVFLACDKNEQLAANYLLDHMHDDHDNK